MKSHLFTKSYILILCANFLFFMGFYLILPILPFFLADAFSASKSDIGSALSCYTLAALLIRPFSGYLMDTFSRKPLYLVAFVVYTVIFSSYILAWCMTVFVVLRMIHGFAFGMVTVGGNTIVIDVMPSDRRGEGLGYYGIANNMAMSVGPMAGLFLHEYHSYTFIFMCSCVVSLSGLVCASFVHTKPRPTVSRPPLSLDRFILTKGIAAGISLLLLSMPYGITTTYIALYSKELGIAVSAGLFFTLMAIGIASSRIFSGKLVDKGYLTQVIKVSMLMTIVVFAMLGLCQYLSAISMTLTTAIYLISALLMGIAFGILFPAYNTLFVNLAPNNQRATAVSTYLTSWDIGIGSGLLWGGWASDKLGFGAAYYIGAMLSVISFILFCKIVTPHYQRDKVR